MGGPPASVPERDTLAPYILKEEGGRSSLHLMVDGLRCGGCVRKIETALKDLPGISEARVNLTTRRLRVAWEDAALAPAHIVETVSGLGFQARPYDPEELGRQDSAGERRLLKAMGVAGFGAANVMLMSVGIWAGQAEGMGEATKALLHWFSMAVALPCILYAAAPFFQTAWSALKQRTTNMDVPISVGILLTTAMSVFETMRGGDHVYFESVLMLAFFLLLGRFLDDRSRAKARSAAERLLSLGGGTVAVRSEDGTVRTVGVQWVRPGDMVLVAAGEKFAVDAIVSEGCSDVDTSLINGETAAAAVAPGDRVYAGMINLSGPLTLRVDAVGEKTLLAEIVRLMETAEQRRGAFVSLADRIVRYYTPVVHLLALAAFLGWVLMGGLAWQPAMLIAVAVLIITCPCALGLAVPAVQVAAGALLMRNGILLKSGSALERLAGIDTVVFDKTGTLSDGELHLVSGTEDAGSLALAGGMALKSRHPLCRALVREMEAGTPLDGVEEHPGQGLLWRRDDGAEVRLGSRRWCAIEENCADVPGPELWLAQPGEPPVQFVFAERLRPDVAKVVGELRSMGVDVRLLSGDRRTAVENAAGKVGIENWQAQCDPAGKSAALEALAADGRKALMVGDGLNDAPALAAAHASLSPSAAADISQTAADAVFQGDHLMPVVTLLRTARRAQALVKQNFLMALLYNALAIPFAVAGFVTPLIAAIAMSASSILVTGNALRIGIGSKGR